MKDRKPEARTVRSVSRQVVVALPTWVQRRVGVAPGTLMYFHRHRAGEVVLSVKPRRVQGTPGRGDLEAELAAAMRERDEYKRQALASERGDYREGHAHGYMAAIRQYGALTDRLDVVLDVVKELRGRVPPLRVARRARPPRAVEVVTLPDQAESPRPDS